MYIKTGKIDNVESLWLHMYIKTGNIDNVESLWLHMYIKVGNIDIVESLWLHMYIKTDNIDNVGSLWLHMYIKTDNIDNVEAIWLHTHTVNDSKIATETIDSSICSGFLNKQDMSNVQSRTLWRCLPDISCIVYKFQKNVFIYNYISGNQYNLEKCKGPMKTYKSEIIKIQQICAVWPCSLPQDHATTENCVVNTVRAKCLWAGITPTYFTVYFNITICHMANFTTLNAIYFVYLSENHPCLRDSCSYPFC